MSEPDKRLPKAPDDPLRPEKRLLGQMLYRASLDYLSPDPKERGDAPDWINSRDASPFSFEWICHVLDMDPEVYREALFNTPDRVKLKRTLSIRMGNIVSAEQRLAHNRG